MTCLEYSKRQSCVACKNGHPHPGVSCEEATAAARSAAAAAYAPAAASAAAGPGGISSLFGGLAAFWNAKSPTGGDAVAGPAASPVAGAAAAGGAGVRVAAESGPAGAVSAEDSLQEWIASQVVSGNIRVCKRCASESAALARSRLLQTFYLRMRP